MKKKLKRLYWLCISLFVRYYYGDPSRRMKVVGVTGTNGKTTVATLLYRVATVLGYKTGLISTVENIVVGEKRAVTHTTPDSVSLTKLFSEMKEKGCQYVFMEVSSHALDQHRVEGIKFTGGIFTNLTHEHLDYHGTMENYLEAKKKFFRMLPESAFALSNADDPYGKKILEGIRAQKFLYEFSNVEGPATLDGFQGELLKNDSAGLEIKIKDQTIRSKLLGQFNAYNLLAVWSVCSLLGFDMGKVREILVDIKPPKGRFEHFTTESGVLVVVDYAHTPDALQNIFQSVKSILPKEGRLISLVGCGGDRDKTKRAPMGQIAVEFSDIAFFTSDNPRSEDPEKIIADMKQGLSMHLLEKVQTVPSRGQAIQMAVQEARKGDIILCAGKGHEDYQEINGVRSHFDDMEEFKKAYE